ncbi:MAG: hypothetical protein ACR2IQ_02055 [Minisyncoccia bacterium]
MNKQMVLNSKNQTKNTWLGKTKKAFGKHILRIIPKDRYPIVQKHEVIVKNIINTTFKNLKDLGTLQYFSMSTYSKEGFLKVCTKTTEGEELVFKFCLSKNPTEKKFYILESYSRLLLIRIKPSIGQKDFEEKISISIDKHMSGFRNEKKFLVLLLFLKENCEKKNIIHVKKTKPKSDLRGSDFIIDYYDSSHCYHSMRLQLKSSGQGQKKHRIKYPDIPSIVWTEEKFPNNLDTFKKIDKLMTNFTNGNICHI